MRPQPVKTVRIRTSSTRNESGSVSPPTPAVISIGKQIFVDKMRKIYGSQDPEQLEFKIEQLWNGLKPSQREKFIGKNGEKENITMKAEEIHVKEKIPVLERRNNCKAIAKVLDLKASKPKSSHSKPVAVKIKAVKREVVENMSTSSPTSIIFQQSTSFGNLRLPNYFENALELDFKIFDKPKKSEETPRVPARIPTNIGIPTGNKASIQKRIQMNNMTRPMNISKSSPVFFPKISYDEACQQYYSTLSQSFLLDSAPANNQMLPIYANIIQGVRPIREYKYGINL